MPTNMPIQLPRNIACRRKAISVLAGTCAICASAILALTYLRRCIPVSTHLVSNEVGLSSIKENENMLPKLLSIACSMAVGAWSAQAATLTNTEGAVSVNRGYGFQQVVAGLQVNPGDRVRTGEGATDIVYENGCAARVGPHQLTVVLSNPPACAGAAFEDSSTIPLVAGLAATGGAGLAIALSSSSNVRPASP